MMNKSNNSYHTFRPGQEWLDTSGKRIQAHGGSVIFVDGYYYWYGENKEKTNGENGIWTYGIKCYKSDDLYNWEDLGYLIPPDLEDEESPFHPSACMLDRPHIIYNKRTKKYVCWIKVMHQSGTQDEVVLTADRITGPYTIVNQGVRPCGMDAGDFDLAVDDNGKAYYYFEHVHSETICAELNDEYTDVTGKYSRHFPHPHPPYVREATAHFQHNGKHYLITSGTTGYLPNPSEVAVAHHWHGPFRVLGNPHRNDRSNTSYHSQISCVFKVEGTKDLYIAMADRWAPDCMDFEYVDYAKIYEKLFTGSEEEKKQIRGSSDFLRIDDLKRETALATYVWLPLRFEKEMVYIDWYNEWSIKDMECIESEVSDGR